MYSWIWRHLPGSHAVKLLQALVLVTAVLALLLLVVFPWLEPRLPFNAVTTDSSAAPIPGTTDSSAAQH
ncbi:MAG: hypothetical protein M3460_12155 [Actinomycetota bacterium]|nr:hypothetical protein [Actinomycetota bacterium]